MVNPQNLAGSRSNVSNLDSYYTPDYCTEALMKREQFNGIVWECACGSGKMARIIAEYNPVVSTDIASGTDFLTSTSTYPNIVTNPPYKLAQRFVEQGLLLATEKLALFLRLNFLEGQRRYNMFKNTPLKAVYVFSKRQTLYPEELGRPDNGGTIAYAWFVWDKKYSGRPVLDWIND